jgi:DNA topoisomerase III
LTSAGRESGAEADILIAVEIEASPRSRAARKRTAKRVAAKKHAKEEAGTGPARMGALRAWRLAEAKKRGVPAFRILTDKSLEAIAVDEPQTLDELLELPGIGPRLVQKYGTEILKIVGR